MNLYDVKLKGESPFLACEACIDEPDGLLYEAYTIFEIESIESEPSANWSFCPFCGRDEDVPHLDDEWDDNDNGCLNGPGLARRGLNRRLNRGE